MRRRRNGVAIFVVVMVCVVIGVLWSIVHFHGRDARRKGAEKRDGAQARFLARGAQNHFLLKFRLLPAELYDAVSYAMGRNPYFNFNLQVEGVSGNSFTPAAGALSDVGPMFFTGPTTNDGMVSASGGRLVIQRPSDGSTFQNAAAGFPPAAGNRARMEYPLNHYILDIVTDHPSHDGAGIVTVSSTPRQDAAQMGKSDGEVVRPRSPTLWADPYTGSYLVRSVRILGSGSGPASAGRRFESDSVMLATEASVLRDRQVSCVTRQGGQLKSLVVAREVAAQLRVEGSSLDVNEKLESDAEYRRRVTDTQSARRTEVMTAVYLVNRRSP